MTKIALKTVWLMAIAVLGCGLVGCGERPQVVRYEQGKYQGKPDTPAFREAPFGGDKQAWDNAMRARAQHQNEYLRIR